MNRPETDYLYGQISNHLVLFYKEKVKQLFHSVPIEFLPHDKCGAGRTTGIQIPTNIPVPGSPEKPYKVNFNDTELTLWNRIPAPPGSGWKAIPDDKSPLWYRNPDGALVPAWNLFGNLMQLLTFEEEYRSPLRDGHGRFIASYSPRLQRDLLEIPAFNEAAAAIVGACHGLRGDGYPSFRLDDLLKPPAIVLSHDCDVLKGDNIWSQVARAARVFIPVTKFKFPALKNLWWIIRNYVAPYRYFFDNAIGMIDLERCFGYSSTYYLINGSKGRFLARNGIDTVRKMIKMIPSGFNLGIHYNYDTFLDERKFSTQMEELEKIAGSGIIAGRAHYLRFDPKRSFPFLNRHGIVVDESSGYSDRIGYRNGIAGCFQPFDRESRKPIDIWEVPLTIMGATLVNQYGGEALDKFISMLSHLGKIGGALTVVFHPEQFYNPEHRRMQGVYHKMLIESRNVGAISMSARSLIERIRQI